MYVAEAALNRLKDAYQQNNEALDATITRMKTIDIDNCRTEKDILILAFTDGTEERINVCAFAGWRSENRDGFVYKRCEW